MKFFRKNGDPAMNTNSGRLRVAEAEGAPEQFYEQSERDQPHGAGQREHQPHRHLGEEQRHDGADQRALGEAEMIVDQQVNVGDVGLARQLVEEDADEYGGVDGKHQPPGVFPHTQIHSAPEAKHQGRTITCGARNARRLRRPGERGTHTP